MIKFIAFLLLVLNQNNKMINVLLKITKSNLLVLIVLTIINFLLFFQSLKFQFTALDDYELILNKKHILSDIKNISFLFKTSLILSESGAYYRPVVSLSFMIDTLMSKSGFSIYYLSNIFYHIFGSFLFFLLMIHLMKDKTKAFLFTIIFSVHPANAQAIVWVPGRNDSLVFIFMALFFITVVKLIYSNKKNYPAILLGGVFYFVALLTKENAFLILLMAVVYIVLFKQDKLMKQKLILPITLLVIITILYLILRHHSSTQKLYLDNITLSFLDYVKGLINYIGKIILPLNLNVITTTENINLVYGFISLIIFSTLTFIGIKNLKMFFFGLMWFFVFLISGMVGVIGFTNFLDHRLYVPLFGFFVALGQLKILDKFSSRVSFLIFLFVFLIFTYLNVNHSKKFSSPLIFYESALQSSPNSFFINRGLANVYHRMKNYELAEKYYYKSIELNPTSTETLNNLAINFKRKNQPDSAEYYLRKALKINPLSATTQNNLGNLYLQMNQIKAAEFHLSKALELNPDYYEAYNNSGVLFARLGNDSLAYENFVKSIQINPYFAEGYFNLALYFYNKSKIDSSKFYYQKAIKNGFPTKNVLSEKLKHF